LLRINATLAGHGILVRSEWGLAKYLDTGRLQTVLPDFKLTPADLFAYFPTRQNMPARVRTFIDFLVSEQ
jgi:DNA-binding transcriptional LysR family regulator